MMHRRLFVFPASNATGGRAVTTLLLLATASCGVQHVAPARAVPALLDVRIDPREADAVLAMLRDRARGMAIADSQWAALFATEGYRRLKRREHSLGRAFEDPAFRAFVESEELLQRRPGLERALSEWSSIDATAPAARAFAYLPSGTRLRATIYPVIKPATNTFVFEVINDPAIFFYLDPAIPAAKFENTLAHELHHIGYAAACAAAPSALAADRLRLGAFGEGIAMLAAAGGPDVHPHATSPPADRERWDRDMANFDSDLRTMERHFLDVLDDRIDEATARQQSMSFYGIQGPWYTVGYGMAVTVERTFGRDWLVAHLCDPAALLAGYNAALDRSGTPAAARARWSERLLEKIGSTYRPENPGP